MYELIIADSDTPLFRAAKSVQQDYILATMPWGETMEFENVTALWGHHVKKEGGWLKEYNLGNGIMGSPQDEPNPLPGQLRHLPSQAIAAGGQGAGRIRSPPAILRLRMRPGRPSDGLSEVRSSAHPAA